jgi:hypothetical protein
MNKTYERVGDTGYVECNGLKVSVKITDYKNSYGKDRFEVTPLQGSGRVWTENVTS